MKRFGLVFLLLSCALMSAVAQSRTSPDSVAHNNGALAPLLSMLATDGGRERLLEAATTLPNAKIQRAAQITGNFSAQLKKYQAEIDVRKAELTRVLLDTHPDMKQVERILKEALNWEYRMRLGEIERDVEVRNVLGDRGWGVYREAQRVLDTLDSMRIQALAAGRQYNTGLLLRLPPREQELLLQLEYLADRLNRGQ